MPDISALTDLAHTPLVDTATATHTEHNTRRANVQTGYNNLTSVLKDLENNYSSASAPGDIRDGKLWYDSGNAALKMRVNGSWQTIDVLTKPNFSAYITASSTPTTTVAIADFSTVVFDSHGGFSTANKYYTIPTAGKYLFNINLYVDIDPTTQDQQYIRVFLYKDSAAIKEHRIEVSTRYSAGLNWIVRNSAGCSWMTTLDLAAAETVSVYVQLSSGVQTAPTTLIGGEQYLSEFSGCRVL